MPFLFHPTRASDVAKMVAAETPMRPSNAARVVTETSPLHSSLAAKEYTHDELVDVKAYLRSVRATALFQALSKDLERSKPEDPVTFVIEWLMCRKAELECKDN